MRILRRRRARKLGSKRLRNALARRHGLKLALDTIPKALVRPGEDRLEQPKLRREGARRSSRPVPGERVRMDTCKIRPGPYPCPAIDDRSRFQIVGLSPRRTAANTRDFLKHVLEGMPLPVQRGQTDRGGEFLAHEVQDDPRKQPIECRPNRPRAPHLKGKVERVQRTALEEFWPTLDPKHPDLAAPREQGRSFYDQHRPPSALGGSTPAERLAERVPKIPTREAVQAAHDPRREPIRSQNTRYRLLPTNARVY
jgi:transposase InsO family protein